jgi:outer membrane protein assembly factor BamB
MTLRLITALMTGAAMLAACSEPEVILAGKRDSINSVLEADAAAAEQEIVNQARPFNAPKPVANANWAQGAGTPNTRTAHPALSSRPALAWSVAIGEGDAKRQRISTDPIVVDGVIYTMDAHATVTAVSTEGLALWQVNLTPQSENAGDAFGGGFAYGDGRLYVTTGYGVAYAMAPKTGEILWSQSVRGAGMSRPTYYDGLVYFVSSDATSWAIEANDGRIRWRIDSVSDVNNLTGSVGPSASEKFVLFGYGSGELQAAFRKGGLIYWNTSLTGGRKGRSVGIVEDLATSPMIVGNRVYAANGSGRFVAMNLDDGERIWTSSQGVRGDVWVAGGSVFLINDIGQLVRVDANTGDVIWAVNLPGFLKQGPKKSKEIYAHHGPVLAGGQIVIASNDGLIRLFDPVSGALSASVAVPDGATTSPVVAGGVLYIVSSKGELHAFR